MTPHQRQLIKDTWAQVEPIADTAAKIFYDRLMEVDPSTRPLFANTDMADRRRTLMQAMAVIVKSIDNLDPIAPAVEQLGRRHTSYGVQAAHFATAGQVLLDTLAIGLGDAFTEEARDAWATAYGVIASVMQPAGESADGAVAA
jgi:hemoglobin-like flavoprotein